MLFFAFVEKCFLEFIFGHVNGFVHVFYGSKFVIDRKFQLAPGVELEAEIGAINSYDMTNVFYFDVNTLRQVNELPLLPYASISLNLN